MDKGIPIKEAMERFPEVKEMIGKLERGEISMCACMGPMYGEPYCGCEMRRKGLPSSAEHIAANEKAEKDLDALFGPGGTYYSGESGIKLDSPPAK